MRTGLVGTTAWPANLLTRSAEKLRQEPNHDQIERLSRIHYRRQRGNW